MSSVDTERPSPLLTLAEVAKRLGLSKRTVQRKVHSGELPVGSSPIIRSIKSPA